MPLLSKTVPLQRFKVGPPPADAAHKLAAYAYGKADLSSTLPQWGVVKLGEPLETNPTLQDFVLGADLAFSLRLSTRAVPAKAVKMEVARLVRDEFAATGKKRISVARKREIKESVTLSIASRAPWVDTVHDVIWRADGELWLCNPNKSALVALSRLIPSVANLDPEKPLEAAGCVTEPGFLDKRAPELAWVVVSRATYAGNQSQAVIRAVDPLGTPESAGAREAGHALAEATLDIDHEGDEYWVTMGRRTDILKINAPLPDSREGNAESAALETVYLLSKIIAHIDDEAAAWAEEVAAKAA